MISRHPHATISAALFAVLIGCSHAEPTPLAQTLVENKEFPFSQLETSKDVQHAVDEAISHDEAIIFVHVDWAMMLPQRWRFADLVGAYRSQYPSKNLVFRYVDCTSVSEGYEPLRAIPGWQELEQANNGTSLIHANGELAWLKNGRVLHVERIPIVDRTDALIAKTVSLGM